MRARRCKLPFYWPVRLKKYKLKKTDVYLAFCSIPWVASAGGMSRKLFVNRIRYLEDVVE